MPRSFLRRAAGDAYRRVRRDVTRGLQRDLIRNALGAGLGIAGSRFGKGDPVLFEFPIGVSANEPYTLIEIVQRNVVTSRGDFNRDYLSGKRIGDAHTYNRPKRIGIVANNGEQFLGHIALPMPSPGGLQFKTDVNYGGRNVGKIARTSLGSYHDVMDELKAFDKKDVMGSITNIGSEALEGFKDIIQSSWKQIKRNTLEKTGELLGIDVAGAQQVNSGLAENSNEINLFEQVNFRIYSFQWILSPKNEKEAIQLDNIIQALSTYILPEYGNERTVGGASVFLRSPPSFYVQFLLPLGDVLGPTQRDYISRSNLDASAARLKLFTIQECHITSVDVVYNSQQGNTQRFLQGRNAYYPTSITLDISFSEIRPPKPNPAGFQQNTDSHIAAVLDPDTAIADTILSGTRQDSSSRDLRPPTQVVIDQLGL